MPKKVHALGVLLASSAGLLFGLTGGSTAVASPLQPDVVSDVPRANTPQLVATGAVGHPAANYMAPLNGDMFVGGLFNAASDTGGTTGGMQNLMSFDIGTNQINDGWRPQANGKVWASRRAPAASSSAASSAASAASTPVRWPSSTRTPARSSSRSTRPSARARSTRSR